MIALKGSVVSKPKRKTQTTQFRFGQQRNGKNLEQRGPEGVILGGDFPQKRPKMMMDRTMVHNCSAPLKPLMKHPTPGMVFNPKALKKSDYLTAMENPMDFGTIEPKLAKNTYVGVGKYVGCSKAKLNRNNFLPKKSYWKPSKSEIPLNAGAVDPAKLVQNSVSKLARKNLREGRGRRAQGCINAKPPVSQGQGACKRSSCGSIKSQRSLPEHSNQASSQVVTSERSLCGDLRVCSPAGASKLDYRATSELTSQMSKYDADSNGAGSATDAAFGEGLLTTPIPIFEAQKSPKKALRAAMLKSRYADTIVKAQLLVNVDKAGPIKMQQEKAKLERRLREEKAEAELELKKQREREREAARIALQNMENTAGIELNLDVQKEFEILIGCYPSHEDIEEGEIVS